MKILLVNQTFHPDVVSTAQHLTDLAVDLASKGHEVSVLAGRRSYDDPSRVFLASEKYRGVNVTRISYTSFGKKNRWTRLADSLSFNVGLGWKWFWLPRQGVVISLTSPPMMPFIASVICRLRKEKFVYWAMDLNPDEAIAAGWLGAKSFVARLLRALNRWTFRNSRLIVALDRFMKRRIIEQYQTDSKNVVVLPPWAHDDHLRPINHGENLFRKAHKLEDKFVVMYSGNHSVCHPLDTVLKAAVSYRNDPGVVFCFIGGGSRVHEVTRFRQAQGLSNIVQLPYQPLQRLSESLSAADVHMVVMGEAFVSIVHPCKIYGVLSVGRPFVFVGPRESAIGDLMEKEQIGEHVVSGDEKGLTAAIERVRRLSSQDVQRIGGRHVQVKDSQFSRGKLSAELVNLIESAGACP